jgi:hypothetical protein
MARSYKSLTTVAGCLILAAFCFASFPTTTLAGPPKSGKSPSSKPSYSKPSYNKPSNSKPTFSKPSYKSSAKQFVKSPKVVFVAHRHGHIHLFPVADPVFVANSIHTLSYIDNDGLTQVYGTYEATTDAFGNTNWGGLMEDQTSLTNAGYQCWIDDMQPDSNG